MAKFTKTRAREPLAEGSPAYAAGKGSLSGEHYDLSMRVGETAKGDGTWLKLTLDRAEAVHFITFAASHMTRGDISPWMDRRSKAQVLRDLADELEREADG